MFRKLLIAVLLLGSFTMYSCAEEEIVMEGETGPEHKVIDED